MASSAGRCATATWTIYRFSSGNSWSKNAPFRILDYIRCNLADELAAVMR